MLFGEGIDCKPRRTYERPCQFRAPALAECANSRMRTNVFTKWPETPGSLAPQVNSLTTAEDAFAMTERIPFSIESRDEYISLLPIGSPLAAFSTK